MTSPLWVGMWREKRTVVFDPEAQPSNPAFIRLYFVQGHNFVVRPRTDRAFVQSVRNPFEIEDALKQYSMYKGSCVDKTKAFPTNTVLVEETPPPQRLKCKMCDGNPNWIDQNVHKETYGVQSEGCPDKWVCRACHGHGFVDDLL